ncbi:transposase [Ornithinibacillus xuwenensis]|uniref:Transposase n=1 Tax=Ornithinibacillus xuwenensis TaxID=3144668 RepID=A0ABU9XJM0_9BACI
MKKKKPPYSRYSKQIKLEAIRRVLEEDQPVQEVIKDLGIRHRDNVYEWIKKYKQNGPTAFDRSFQQLDKKIEKVSVEQQLEELRTEIDALKSYLEIILQCDEEKYKAIQVLEGQYPIEILCHALDVSQVGFLEYRQRQRAN